MSIFQSGRQFLCRCKSKSYITTVDGSKATTSGSHRVFPALIIIKNMSVSLSLESSMRRSGSIISVPKAVPGAYNEIIRKKIKVD